MWDTLLPDPKKPQKISACGRLQLTGNRPFTSNLGIGGRATVRFYRPNMQIQWPIWRGFPVFLGVFSPFKVQKDQNSYANFVWSKNCSRLAQGGVPFSKWFYFNS